MASFSMAAATALPGSMPKHWRRGQASPPFPYAEVRDFGPFDTIVYVGGLYVGKTTGLAKTARRLPTDHPFRLLVATVGLADPANEDNLLSIRESLAKELSPASLSGPLMSLCGGP